MDAKSASNQKKIAPMPDAESALGKSSTRKVIESIFPHEVQIDHKADEDTLLDVHIGNPLRRITHLLEEIKKQKAFTFTLKGSLGIAGIALVITSFGIFGGTKAFCSKGTQSHIGILHQLVMKEKIDRPYLVDRAMIIWDAVTGKDFAHKDRSRTVLVKEDRSVLHMIERVDGLTLNKYTGTVIATGDFDSCAQSLTLKDINSVEEL